VFAHHSLVDNAEEQKLCMMMLSMDMMIEEIGTESKY